MSDYIKIEKTTFLMFMGLVLAVVISGYVLFNPGDNIDNTKIVASKEIIDSKNVQDIYLRALSTFSYDKPELNVKKGVPVRLHFTADPQAGCGRQVILYGMDISLISKNGEEQIAEFIPQKEGSFEYNCGMRMMRGGKLVVS